MMRPVSSTHTQRRIEMVPVSGSTSTMAAWAPAAKVPRIGS
jgi:hypothetical protein